MEIKTFGVVGAGQMGNGIAQVVAASGLNVIMNDIKTEFVEKGLASITLNLQRAVDKGKLSAGDQAALLGRIKPSVDLTHQAQRGPQGHGGSRLRGGGRNRKRAPQV